MALQFHPLAFGVMIVVAVGTLAYTLWNINREQEQPYRSRSSRPSNRSHSSRSNLRNNDQSVPSRSGANAENKKPRKPTKEDTCSICLLDLKNDLKTLSCTHIYHNHCISTWFKMEKTCPICRRIAVP